MLGYVTDVRSGVRRLEDSARSNIPGAKIFTNVRKTLEAVGEKRLEILGQVAGQVVVEFLVGFGGEFH